MECGKFLFGGMKEEGGSINFLEQCLAHTNVTEIFATGITLSSLFLYLIKVLFFFLENAFYFLKKLSS